MLKNVDPKNLPRDPFQKAFVEIKTLSENLFYKKNNSVSVFVYVIPIIPLLAQYYQVWHNITGAKHKI